MQSWMFPVKKWTDLSYRKKWVTFKTGITEMIWYLIVQNPVTYIGINHKNVFYKLGFHQKETTNEEEIY